MSIMKFNSITIVDIAKALGVSKSTVSRALQDSFDISAATKEKILTYARENHYEPNLSAKGLQQRKTFTIGVLVPELKNNFFAQVIEGIDEVVYKKGYQIVIAQSYEQMEREVEAANHLANRSIDGLIVSVAANNTTYSHFLELQKKGLPLVFFDRVAEDCPTHNVVVDNYKVAFDASTMLLKQGHKRILFATHSLKLNITKERIAGFRDALAQYGVTVTDDMLYTCDYANLDMEVIVEELKRRLKGPNIPTAIFSSGDRITSIIYGAVMQLELSIPKDISFVGFSNNNMLDLLNTNLIVIRQPAADMGKAAAELLLGLIDSKKPTKVFEKRVLQPIILNSFNG